MSEQRVAYWTRPENRPEPCWRVNCTNDAATVQDDRFRGRYCEPCAHHVAADAERLGMEGVEG